MLGLPQAGQAPDAVAFVVEADGQKLFYSGDSCGHGRKRVLFGRLLKNPARDVDCLLIEGTTLGRPDGAYRDEGEVEEAVRAVIESTDSHTFVFASSQNLDRLVSVCRHIDCYRENYRQKRPMGLFDETLPDEIEIEERVEGLVVTGGYSQLAEKAREQLERRFDVRVQVMKNVIRPV